MQTQPDEFAHLLATPEGSHIEFKEAKGEYRFEKLLDYCVALANEGGGRVVLGVTDRKITLQGIEREEVVRRKLREPLVVPFASREIARINRRGCRRMPGTRQVRASFPLARAL